MATGIRKPELKLQGNVQENFRNFRDRFNDYCIQSNYRDLAKDPDTEKTDYYKSPLLEIAALRSSLPDEALQVLRYTIEPRIAAGDKAKPWIWMQELYTHYTGSTGSCLMSDRFTFWNSNQSPQECIQDWEVKVRQMGSLCEFGAKCDEMCRDKFVFGLHCENIRTELLKSHKKANGDNKTLADMVSEARALETAKQTNRIIMEKTHISEQVNFTRHRDMRLKREPGTCFYCGDTRGPHPWRSCPAKGKTCSRCGGNDHYARVCEETPRRTTNSNPTSGTQTKKFNSTPGYRGRRSGGPSRRKQEAHQLESEPLRQQEQPAADNNPVYYSDGYGPPQDYEEFQTYALEDEEYMYAADSVRGLFSWHPTLMTIAFMFLMAEAILIFSPQSSLLQRAARKAKVKTHWIAMVGSLTAALLGVASIWYNKEKNGKPHASTSHGQLGYVTLCYIIVQCLGGSIHLYPNIASKIAKLATLKLLHATSGLVAFTAVVASLMLGMNSSWFRAEVTGTSFYACMACPVLMISMIGGQVVNSYLMKGTMHPSKTSKPISAGKADKKQKSGKRK